MAQRPTVPTAWRPYIGLAAVLLGSVIATLTGRITSFGLADIRGAVHAGFDEGAWIVTASNAAQMAVTVPAVWLGRVFGARRVLQAGALVFALGALTAPLSQTLAGVLLSQVAIGLGSGVFIPLTIGFVLQSLPTRLIAYGIAVYGMNSEFSQNIAASLEGFWIDHASWRWIFWQNVPIALVMIPCIRWGMPEAPIDRDLVREADWPGMVFASLGFTLIFAALDQGNRLDWLNSRLIVGLLAGGATSLAAFILLEATTPRPILRLRFAVSGNIPLLAAMLTLYRFVILSTSFLIPQHLMVEHGYRALDVGGVLLWIALPQILLAPVVGAVLRRVDPRIPLAFGYALVGAGCFMASAVTRAWASDAFLPSQVVQAVGQSFCLISLVFFSASHVKPAEILSFGAVIQSARMIGGEIGSAFMQTYVRVVEQTASNVLGGHVDAVTAHDRLSAYAKAVTAGPSGASEAASRALALLAGATSGQANVLAFASGFRLLGFATLLGLFAMLALRSAPSSKPPAQASK